MNKHVQKRRETLREFAKREAAARCAYLGCQLPLSRLKRDAGIRFCDDICDDAHELDLTRKARR